MKTKLKYSLALILTLSMLSACGRDNFDETAASEEEEEDNITEVTNNNYTSDGCRITNDEISKDNLRLTQLRKDAEAIKKAKPSAKSAIKDEAVLVNLENIDRETRQITAKYEDNCVVEDDTKKTTYAYLSAKGKANVKQITKIIDELLLPLLDAVRDEKARVAHVLEREAEVSKKTLIELTLIKITNKKSKKEQDAITSSMDPLEHKINITTKGMDKRPKRREASGIIHASIIELVGLSADLSNLAKSTLSPEVKKLTVAKHTYVRKLIYKLKVFRAGLNLGKAYNDELPEFPAPVVVK